MTSESSNVKSLFPLIDADIICYRSGFACRDDEPVENALHNVKMAMTQILEVFPEAPGYRTFLTGSNNFRKTVATIKPYKGNRKDDAKPKYYNEIREYLLAHWNAELVEGREADDALGCTQWEHKDKSTCIVSTDKDLNMVPGWHYNFVKKELYYVTLDQANRMFFWQMLVGDSTDNIPGIHKIGPKNADKIIAECEEDPDRILDRITSLYQKQYGNGWEAAFNEIATLLWIQRETGQDCPYLIL